MVVVIIYQLALTGIYKHTIYMRRMYKDNVAVNSMLYSVCRGLNMFIGLWIRINVM